MMTRGLLQTRMILSRTASICCHRTSTAIFDSFSTMACSTLKAPASWQTCDYSGYQSASKTYLTLARRQLQKILPPRDDVAAIAGFSFPWMSIYNALFPRIRFMATAEEMLTQYDELCSPNADPMSLANLLISLALSVRQIPEADLKPLVPGIPNVSRFIGDVTETVDRTIASNDTLAATLEGIETSLLFIRL
jgi:hypothetical protein